MGINISVLVVLAVLTIVLAMMGSVSIISQTVVNVNLQEGIDLSGVRARTDLSIVTTSTSGADLTVTVANTGATTVFDFAHMDFIVDYTEPSGGGTQVISRLTYTKGALGNNQWKKTSVSPDDFEPGAWNPGETVTLDARLDPAPQTGTTGTVAVGTPNGVLVTGYFPN